MKRYAFLFRIQPTVVFFIFAIFNLVSFITPFKIFAFSLQVVYFTLIQKNLQEYLTNSCNTTPSYFSWCRIRYFLYLWLLLAYITNYALPDLSSNENLILPGIVSFAIVLYYFFKLSMLIYDVLRNSIRMQPNYFVVLLSMIAFFPFGVWYLQKYFNQLYDLDVQGQLRDSEN